MGGGRRKVARAAEVDMVAEKKDKLRARVV